MRERPERDDDPRVVLGSTRHSLRMLPIVDAVYPAAKAVFWPWLRYGLRWTIEGESSTSRRTVRRSSRATTSRISIRSRWPGSPTGASAGSASSPRPSCSRSPALGPLLRAAHQIPVYRGTADSSGALVGRGRRAAPRANASRCSPRARSRWTSSRCAASRERRGSRRPSGVAVVPVGLWGTHRMLMKGRKPHWAWGVAQVAVVGEPVRDRRGRARARRDAAHHGRDHRVRRAGARDLPAAARRPATTRGGGASPDTATAHRRPA